MQGKFSFIFLYTLYALISYFLALWTTAGWSGFAITFLFFPLSSLPLLLYIVFFTILHLRKKAIVLSKYSKLLFLAILIDQFFALLFNLGDCGDAIGVGPYNFIQHFTQPQMFNNIGNCMSGLSPIFPNSPILWLIYFAGLIASPILIFINSVRMSSINKVAKR